MPFQFLVHDRRQAVSWINLNGCRSLTIKKSTKHKLFKLKLELALFYANAAIKKTGMTKASLLKILELIYDRLWENLH